MSMANISPVQDDASDSCLGYLNGFLTIVIRLNIILILTSMHYLNILKQIIKIWDLVSVIE